jgi:hypothetical protein
MCHSYDSHDFLALRCPKDYCVALLFDNLEERIARPTGRCQVENEKGCAISHSVATFDEKGFGLVATYSACTERPGCVRGSEICAVVIDRSWWLKKMNMWYEHIPQHNSTVRLICCHLLLLFCLSRVKSACSTMRRNAMSRPITRPIKPCHSRGCVGSP